MQYDLFISHSSADAETALALVTDFENRNITCWMAPRDIPMGSSYHEEIVQAIENSRAVLLLFSNAANKSEHVLREVELAAQGKKPILPLRIDVSELFERFVNEAWTSERLRVLTSSETKIATVGEIERRIANTSTSLCSAWLENQFGAEKGELKPQKPMPMRVIWSATGPKDDPSMYGRVTF